MWSGGGKASKKIVRKSPKGGRPRKNRFLSEGMSCTGLSLLCCKCFYPSITLPSCFILLYISLSLTLTFDIPLLNFLCELRCSFRLPFPLCIALGQILLCLSLPLLCLLFTNHFSLKPSTRWSKLSKPASLISFWFLE